MHIKNSFFMIHKYC